jgi:hypothetical protein
VFVADEDPESLKIRLDHELARFTLRGTLKAAFAGLGFMLIIALSQIFMGRNVVEGWAFAFMAVTVPILGILYGAFVFNRTISIEGTVKGASFKTRSGGEVVTHVTTPQSEHGASQIRTVSDSN